MCDNLEDGKSELLKNENPMTKAPACPDGSGSKATPNENIHYENNKCIYTGNII